MKVILRIKAPHGLVSLVVTALLALAPTNLLAQVPGVKYYLRGQRDGALVLKVAKPWQPCLRELVGSGKLLNKVNNDVDFVRSDLPGSSLYLLRIDIDVHLDVALVGPDILADRSGPSLEFPPQIVQLACDVGSGGIISSIRSVM